MTSQSDATQTASAQTAAAQSNTARRIGKYACLELERRYLLRELPATIHADSEHWRIEDRYIPGTRLRVRRMAWSSGTAVQYKLGQKYRDEGQDATQTTMTNIYLNEAEYAQLQTLPARLLHKRRYPYSADGRHYGIDVFEDHLRGLILAETECDTLEEVAALLMPAFALADVTGIPFFTGGNLASIASDDFRRELAQWLAGKAYPEST